MYAVPAEAQEAQIVNACRRDPDAAFETLYRTYAEPLRRFCIRRLGSREDAEDVAHEVLIRAYAGLPGLGPEVRLWAWLTTIAANLCIDLQRRAALGERTSLPCREPVSLEDELAARVRAAILLRAIDELPPERKAPFVLRELMDWTYADIASVLGRNVSWVKTTLMRTRRAMPRLVTSVALRDRAWPLPAIVVAARVHVRRIWRHVSATTRRASSRTPIPAHYGDVATLLGSGLHVVFALVAGVMTLGATVAPGPIQSSRHERAPVAVATPASVDEGALGKARDTTPPPAPSRGRSEPPPPLDVALPEAEGLLRDWVVEQPHQDSIQSFAVSPDYERDGVVYAVGGRLCVPACTSLYRSDDRGATWTKLPAIGMHATSLALPPDPARDNRIFAGGLVGLQMSEDGGRTFRTVAPARGAPVISPGFGSGDERVFALDGVPWEYDAREGRASPLPIVAPETTFSVRHALALSPTFVDDGVMWVGGWSMRDTSSDVYRCSGAFCEKADSSIQAGFPQLLAGKDASTVFEWHHASMARSDDGGRTFRTLDRLSSLRLTILSATRADDGSLYVVGWRPPTWHTTGLYRSTDGGETWSEIRTTGSEGNQVWHVLPLPDGRLIVALSTGIACSVDGGRHWSSTCPR